MLVRAPRAPRTVIVSMVVATSLAIATFVAIFAFVSAEAPVAVSLVAVSLVAVKASVGVTVKGSTVRVVRLMVLSVGRSRSGWRGRRDRRVSPPRPKSCRRLVDGHGRVQPLRLAGCHDGVQLLWGECRWTGRTGGRGGGDSRGRADRSATSTGRVGGSDRAGGGGIDRNGGVQLLRRKQWRAGNTGGSGMSSRPQW